MHNLQNYAKLLLLAIHFYVTSNCTANYSVILTCFAADILDLLLMFAADEEAPLAAKAPNWGALQHCYVYNISSNSKDRAPLPPLA